MSRFGQRDDRVAADRRGRWDIHRWRAVGRLGAVSRRPHMAGVTLIEVMIVIAVFGLMAATVVVGFGAGRSAEVARTVNQLANTIRYAYDKARVTGDHYRLLIDLEQNSFALQKGEDRMYLPATDRDGKPIVLDEDDVEQREERDRKAAEQYYRSVQSAVYDVDTDGGGFDPFGVRARDVPRRRPPLFESFEEENTLSGLSAPIHLPEGIKIAYVRTAEDPQPILSGQAAIYFFPQGRTQQAHVQIAAEDGNIEYTLTVQPLTGKVTIRDGLIPLELPDDPSDAEDDLGKRQERRSF